MANWAHEHTASQTGRMQQIEAASGGAGTGVNGGDWQWVSPAVYKVGDDRLRVFDGAVVETIDIDVTEAGGTVSLELQAGGGGDLTFYFAGVPYVLDTTPADAVALTAGTDAVPQINFIYVVESAGVLTLTNSTSDFPTTSHAPIATVLLKTAATTATDGAVKVHAHTDHVNVSAENGHFQHVNEWIRARPAGWMDGCAAVTMQVSAPDAYFSFASGNVRQLHPHAMPAIDMNGAHAYVVNDPTTAFLRITSLDDITQDASGGAINNKWGWIVMWGVVSEKTGDCQMMLNLPTATYNAAAAAQDDPNRTAVTSIPSDFTGTGFLIAAYLVQMKTSGTWVEDSIVNLRGDFPSTLPSIGGGGGGTGDVVGPGSAVDDQIAVFDGTTGKLIKDGGATIASIKPPTINDFDSVGGLLIPLGVPTPVPPDTTQHNGDLANYAGATGIVTVQRDGNYEFAAHITLVELAATATLFGLTIEVRSPATVGAWVPLPGSTAAHSAAADDTHTLPSFGTWVETGGLGFDVRMVATNTASAIVNTVADASRLAVVEVA